MLFATIERTAYFQVPLLRALLPFRLSQSAAMTVIRKIVASTASRVIKIFKIKPV